jgi:hypothetical protein
MRDAIVQVMTAAHPQPVSSRYVQDRLPGRPSLAGITMFHMAQAKDRIQVNPEWAASNGQNEKTYILI